MKPMTELTPEKIDDRDGCSACGENWNDHNGIRITCQALQDARAEIAALQARIAELEGKGEAGWRVWSDGEVYWVWNGRNLMIREEGIWMEANSNTVAELESDPDVWELDPASRTAIIATLPEEVRG